MSHKAEADRFLQGAGKGSRTVALAASKELPFGQPEADRMSSLFPGDRSGQGQYASQCYAFAKAAEGQLQSLSLLGGSPTAANQAAEAASPAQGGAAQKANYADAAGRAGVDYNPSPSPNKTP